MRAKLVGSYTVGGGQFQTLLTIICTYTYLFDYYLVTLRLELDEYLGIIFTLYLIISRCIENRLRQGWLIIITAQRKIGVSLINKYYTWIIELSKFCPFFTLMNLLYLSSLSYSRFMKVKLIMNVNDRLDQRYRTGLCCIFTIFLPHQ